MYVWEYVCVEGRGTREEKISGNTYSIYYTHVGGFFSTPAHSIPYVGARGGIEGYAGGRGGERGLLTRMHYKGVVFGKM